MKFFLKITHNLDKKFRYRFGSRPVPKNVYLYLYLYLKFIKVHTALLVTFNKPTSLGARGLGTAESSALMREPSGVSMEGRDRFEFSREGRRSSPPVSMVTTSSFFFLAASLLR